MDAGCRVERLQRAGAVCYELREETIRGQYLDLVTQAEGALRVPNAGRVAEAKTAASTTCGPRAFDAALAEAGRDLCEAYAAPLGAAFQLRDDLLGALGDPMVTGKPSGDDRDGKCTVLLAQTAPQRSSPTSA